MNCRNCGAPMQLVPGGEGFRCEFCASFHFPAPSLDGVSVLGTPAELDCPACGQTLVEAVAARVRVRHCPGCQGVLADAGTFGKIVAELRSRYRGERVSPRPVEPAERERVLACPGCGRPMEAHPYHGPGRVWIDSCGPCRLVWLDRGEIGSIQRA